MFRLASCVLAGVLASGALAFAASTAPALAGIAQQQQETVTAGTIKSVDHATRSFVLAVGEKDLTFKVNAQTVYMIDEKPSTKELVLTSGRSVRVTHNDQIASKVQVQTKKS